MPCTTVPAPGTKVVRSAKWELSFSSTHSKEIERAKPASLLCDTSPPPPNGRSRPVCATCGERDCAPSALPIAVETLFLYWSFLDPAGKRVAALDWLGPGCTLL